MNDEICMLSVVPDQTASTLKFDDGRQSRNNLQKQLDAL